MRFPFRQPELNTHKTARPVKQNYEQVVRRFAESRLLLEVLNPRLDSEVWEGQNILWIVAHRLLHTAKCYPSLQVGKTDNGQRFQRGRLELSGEVGKTSVLVARKNKKKKKRERAGR